MKKLVFMFVAVAAEISIYVRSCCSYLFRFLW